MTPTSGGHPIRTFEKAAFRRFEVGKHAAPPRNDTGNLNRRALADRWTDGLCSPAADRGRSATTTSNDDLRRS